MNYQPIITNSSGCCVGYLRVPCQVLSNPSLIPATDMWLPFPRKRKLTVPCLPPLGLSHAATWDEPFSIHTSATRKCWVWSFDQLETWTSVFSFCPWAELRYTSKGSSQDRSQTNFLHLSCVTIFRFCSWLVFHKYWSTHWSESMLKLLFFYK